MYVLYALYLIDFGQFPMMIHATSYIFLKNREFASLRHINENGNMAT